MTWSHIRKTRFLSHIMRGSRGGDRGSRPPPLKNHKNIGFSSNTGPDPLKNRKATKSAFNAGPPSTHQRNAIKWTAYSGTWSLELPSPHQLKKKKKKKKNVVKIGPPLTKLSGSGHAYIRSPYISLSDILSYHVVPSTEYSVGLYNRERLQTIDSFNDTVAVSAGSCKYQPRLKI